MRLGVGGRKPDCANETEWATAAEVVRKAKVVILIVHTAGEEPIPTVVGMHRATMSSRTVCGSLRRSP
jgi:hypothetical protein